MYEEYDRNNVKEPLPIFFLRKLGFKIADILLNMTELIICIFLAAGLLVCWLTWHAKKIWTKSKRMKKQVAGKLGFDERDAYR